MIIESCHLGHQLIRLEQLPFKQCVPRSNRGWPTIYTFSLYWQSGKTLDSLDRHIPNMRHQLNGESIWLISSWFGVRIPDGAPRDTLLPLKVKVKVLHTDLLFQLPLISHQVASVKMVDSMWLAAIDFVKIKEWRSKRARLLRQWSLCRNSLTG